MLNNNVNELSPEIMAKNLQSGYDYNSHFIELDFNKIEELDALCDLSRQFKFDKICFDYSVIKFFLWKQFNILSRFQCIKELLKSNGILYIKDYNDYPGGSKPSENITNYGQKLIKELKVIGFEVEIKNLNFENRNR